MTLEFDCAHCGASIHHTTRPTFKVATMTVTIPHARPGWADPYDNMDCPSSHEFQWSHKPASGWEATVATSLQQMIADMEEI